MAAEEPRGQAEPAEPGQALDAAVDDSLQNGALVLCNPGTSSVPDIDQQTPRHQPEVHLHAAAPQDSRDCGGDGGEVSGLRHVSPVCKSSHHIERTEPSSRWPVSLPSIVLVVQGLCTSVLALVNSLVMLLISPQLLHSSGACGLLVYLDPGLSLLAVITLIATAAPQVSLCVFWLCNFQEFLVINATT